LFTVHCRTVEVAHEALISSWGVLRAWVNEDREFLLWRERLDALFAESERAEGKEDALLRGSLLIEAQKWLDLRSSDLSNHEREFIAASRELRQRLAREEIERNERELDSARKLAEARRRQRNFTMALAAAMLVAALVACIALVQWRRAQLALQSQYEVWKVKGVIKAEPGLDYQRVGVWAIGGLPVEYSLTPDGAFAVSVPVAHNQVEGKWFPKVVVGAPDFENYTVNPDDIRSLLIDAQSRSIYIRDPIILQKLLPYEPSILTPIPRAPSH
jgi:hypothetical protein